MFSGLSALVPTALTICNGEGGRSRWPRSLIAEEPCPEEPLAACRGDEGIHGQPDHDQRHEDALVGVPRRQVRRQRGQRQQNVTKEQTCVGE